MWGTIVDATDWIDQMDTYGEMSGVRAIVLHINSPGGYVTPSQELWRRVRELREKDGKSSSPISTMWRLQEPITPRRARMPSSARPAP